MEGAAGDALARPGAARAALPPAAALPVAAPGLPPRAGDRPTGVDAAAAAALPVVTGKNS